MKPLVDKLGYRAGMGTQVWRLPEALRAELAPLLADGSESPRFQIAFAKDRVELAQAANDVAAAYRPGGHLRMCYPKKSGSIRTDVSRDIGWEPVQARSIRCHPGGARCGLVGSALPSARRNPVFHSALAIRRATVSRLSCGSTIVQRRR